MTKQMLDIRVYDFQCSNMSNSLHRPVVVMPAHLWLGALPQNAAMADWFTAHWGRDAFGTVPFFAQTAAWLLSPKPHILALVAALAETLSRFGFRLGLQARVGIPLDATNYNDRPPADAGPEFVRCAYAYTPAARKGLAAGWVIVGDQAHVKAAMLGQLALAEGPITAAANELALRALGLPPHLFAADGVLGAAPGRIRAIPLLRELEELGFAVAEFASGARAVV